MDIVHFVDTTIRDGPQSLWASRMSTGMILPIVGNLDAAGFQAVEIMTGAQFKKAVSELREDPWDLCRRVAAGMKRTPLRFNAGRVNPFGFEPPEIYQLFVDSDGGERCEAGADFGAVERSAGLDAAYRCARKAGRQRSSTSSTRFRRATPTTIMPSAPARRCRSPRTGCASRTRAGS